MDSIQDYLLFIGCNYYFVNKNNVELYEIVFLFFSKRARPSFIC
jgi:hypothetical protein